MSFRGTRTLGLVTQASIPFAFGYKSTVQLAIRVNYPKPAQAKFVLQLLACRCEGLFFN